MDQRQIDKPVTIEVGFAAAQDYSPDGNLLFEKKIIVGGERNIGSRRQNNRRYNHKRRYD